MAKVLRVRAMTTVIVRDYDNSAFCCHACESFISTVMFAKAVKYLQDPDDFSATLPAATVNDMSIFCVDFESRCLH